MSACTKDVQAKTDNEAARACANDRCKGAVMRSALKASIDALNERLTLADCIGDALAAAAGDNPVPWLYVYQQQIESIRQAAEAVEIIISKGAS